MRVVIVDLVGFGHSLDEDRTDFASFLGSGSATSFCPVFPP